MILAPKTPSGDISTPTASTKRRIFLNDDGVVATKDSLGIVRIVGKESNVIRDDTTTTVTPTHMNAIYEYYAASSAMFIANPTTTPEDGDTMKFRINGVSTTHALSFGSSYKGIGAALPSTTATAGKWMYFDCIYCDTDTAWHVFPVMIEV